MPQFITGIVTLNFIKMLDYLVNILKCIQSQHKVVKNKIFKFKIKPELF